MSADHKFLWGRMQPLSHSSCMTCGRPASEHAPAHPVQGEARADAAHAAAPRTIHHAVDVVAAAICAADEAGDGPVSSTDDIATLSVEALANAGLLTPAAAEVEQRSTDVSDVTEATRFLRASSWPREVAEEMEQRAVRLEGFARRLTEHGAEGTE